MPGPAIFTDFDGTLISGDAKKHNDGLKEIYVASGIGQTYGFTTMNIDTFSKDLIAEFTAKLKDASAYTREHTLIQDKDLNFRCMITPMDFLSDDVKLGSAYDDFAKEYKRLRVIVSKYIEDAKKSNRYPNVEAIIDEIPAFLKELRKTDTTFDEFVKKMEAADNAANEAIKNIAPLAGYHLKPSEVVGAPPQYINAEGITFDTKGVMLYESAKILKDQVSSIVIFEDMANIRKTLQAVASNLKPPIPICVAKFEGFYGNRMDHDTQYADSAQAMSGYLKEFEPGLHDNFNQKLQEKAAAKKAQEMSQGKYQACIDNILIPQLSLLDSTYKANANSKMFAKYKTQIKNIIDSVNQTLNQNHSPEETLNIILKTLLGSLKDVRNKPSALSKLNFLGSKSSKSTPIPTSPDGIINADQKDHHFHRLVILTLVNTVSYMKKQEIDLEKQANPFKLPEYFYEIKCLNDNPSYDPFNMPALRDDPSKTPAPRGP